MSIRRASVILPGNRLEDFPTHLTDQAAAELLAAATALWHPSLIHATQALPGLHSADDPPDPATLDGELVLIPPASRQRMASDWCDRLRATSPRNPPPIEAEASRKHTVARVLGAAAIDAGQVAPESVADFLALGFAHLQIELLTRALRYTSVLDSDQFTSAVVAAAGAAVAGNQDTSKEELSRAFDLLADARNHVYSVDFYLIDITLLVDSTLGEVLRSKLAAGAKQQTCLSRASKSTGWRSDHHETLAELNRGLEAGTNCIVGGLYRGGLATGQSPETLLAGLIAGQEAARRHLNHEYEIYGQFDSEFSPLMPAVLKNMGFRGALHAAFDGGGLPRADQRKTNWGADVGSSIEALSATPLDVSRPETWLKLAERIGDSIAHDHVATIVLAGFPGTGCEYFDDLRRAARYGTVLGKLITLDAYFRETRQADEWTKFYSREYGNQAGTEFGANPISSRVDAYRHSIRQTQQQLAAGLGTIAGFTAAIDAATAAANSIVINPWNVAGTHFVNANFLQTGDRTPTSQQAAPLYVPDLPGCGYATFTSAASPPRVALADDVTLRNEWMELTVSRKTGGIQSLRRHTDRNTRVSQRLVFHHDIGDTPLETRMVADKVEISRNELLVGEITSRGRVLDAGRGVVTRFTQRVRAIRGLPVMIVDVELDPQHLPDGDIWKSYFASRLAWAEEAVGYRRGKQWSGRESTRECMESPEWVEVDDAIGSITCLALGLPFHRVAAPARLDTLLLVAGEDRRRFQFALSLDRNYPTHAALALLSAANPCLCASPIPPSSPHGWFLHVDAKNVLCTHVEPLLETGAGIRVRLLETEGRETQTTIAAFRPFQSAWITDFRGNRTDSLSVTDGRPQIDIGPYGWIQIEAEW